jgi:hypothetical protein
MAMVMTVAQAAFGPNHSAYAMQTGRSYFENAAPNLPYTNGSGSGCVAGLIGYVIPNYTKPDWSQPAGHQCDGSGAVGDMRMNQVAAAVGYGGSDRRAKFYYLLKYDYDFGNTWERAGASEIALSLLGFGFGSLPSRTISAAQWADLYSRLTAPDIEFIWASDSCGASWCLPGVSFRFNTAGVVANGRYDAIKVDNGTNNHVDAWVIRSASTGKVYSTYEIECGNGIGTAFALPKPAQWNFSMKDAYIRQLNPATGVPLAGAAGASHGTNVNVNGVPGERYGIYHWWINNGADPTDVTTYVRQVYTYPGAGQKTVDKYKTHAPGIAGGGGWLWNGITGDTGKIPQSAIGKSYCMRTEAWPGSWNNAAPKVGSTMCINVVRSFNLIPTVSVPILDLPPGDATITPTPKVANAGPTDSYPNTYWQLVRFVIPVGGGNAPGTSSGGTAAPCVYYTGAACGGKNIMLAQGNSTFGMPSTTLGPIPPDTVTGLIPGQKLCYALSVKGYDAAHNPATSSEYRYGTPICIKVAKKPKLQIWGGDVRTRGNITTSVSTMGGAQYGSWVEYAAFSAGSNASYNFASGSGFAGGNNLSIPERNLLTFANTPTGSYGSYPVPTMVTTLADQFTAATPLIAPLTSSAVTSYAPGSLATGTYKTSAAGTVTINGGTLKGTSVVIIAPGTVNITGDILYQSSAGTDTFADATQLPQLIIIAKAITISGSVKTVNAWLLTTGLGNSINTCSDVGVAAPLSTTICSNPLVVNGPILTDTLYLRRTAGAATVATAGDPAEVFNLRADTYLWASGKTAQSGRVQTDQLTEAAPRF